MWKFGEFADASEIDAILKEHPEDREQKPAQALAKVLSRSRQDGT